MVNADSPEAPQERQDRRERTRGTVGVGHAPLFGDPNRNPFGDLHTLQHLSARLARSLRGVFEPLQHKALRSWAEPVSVQRFADYRVERGDGLTAWLPMEIQPTGGHALLVMDGRFVLELLDLFFGGNGEAPHNLPGEFSPSAEAMVQRLATMMLDSLHNAWEPIARLTFDPRHVEINPAMFSSLDGDDPMVVTRFGLAGDKEDPVFIDIIYPVADLKPHAPSLTAKVHGRTAEADPKWQHNLTRSTMSVKFPVRSVLAEPVVSLGKLMELKEGDVLPISFGTYVPVMVGRNRLGTGTVGTANGRAAIRLHSLERIEEEDFQ
ncbi:flagellar motor switch protein FliM [Stakelama sediminis]|uniref:Flagellar motor switch protein FliM n=1 Tax=Stakelama sediminis TaxID=463200 RepID=A0A840YWX2_9SPHN|nr:flagellar motor switch protein FliM [Stakelama sediminis]MBB5718036.1 flagellar motor switch protein FliM [Stakelama sediminis]